MPMYCPGELALAQMGYDDGGIQVFCGVPDSLGGFRSAPCGFSRVVGYEVSLVDVLAAAMERPEHPPASDLHDGEAR